jgi:putative phosphonate metabolism protein
LRYGIYYAPRPDTDFARLANAWLGRDSVTDAVVSQPDVPGFSPEDFAALTAEPRRYGFHGTIKAPFALDAGATEANLLAELSGFAASRSPVPVGRLEVVTLHGFVALVPRRNGEALNAFAAEVVRHFDRFRAPLAPEDRARRNPSVLSERQRGYLDRWGYPYIFEDFGFHLTLSRRLEAADAERVRVFAEEHFAAVLEDPLLVDALTLFVEAAPGSPFTVVDRFPFTVQNQGKTAPDGD